MKFTKTLLTTALFALSTATLSPIAFADNASQFNQAVSTISALATAIFTGFAAYYTRKIWINNEILKIINELENAYNDFFRSIDKKITLMKFTEYVDNSLFKKKPSRQDYLAVYQEVTDKQINIERIISLLNRLIIFNDPTIERLSKENKTNFEMLKSYEDEIRSILAYAFESEPENEDEHKIYPNQSNTEISLYLKYAENIAKDKEQLLTLLYSMIK